MVKYDIIIGIDPDINKSGVCVLTPNSRLITLDNLAFPALIEFLQKMKSEYDKVNMIVIVEAVADENAIAINKDGVLNVAVANRNQHVACTVEVIYTNAKGHTFPSVLTKVVYDGRLLSLEQQDFTFDKTSRDSIVMNIAIEEGLAEPKVYDATNYDAKKPEASLKEIPSVYNAASKTITISNKDVCSLKTGANKLFVKSGDIIAPLNVVTVGKVSLSKDAIGNNYDIYTPDQIVEMMSLTGNDTADKTFNITRDIDMGGIVIPSLAELGARGVINGNGHTISRYTINNVIGNNAGFVAVNRGTIKNVTLIGNVDVSVPSAIKSTTNVGGVVGFNDGLVENVKTAGETLTYDGWNNVTFGNVNAYNASLNVAVTFNVGGIVGLEGNNSSIINCATTAPKAAVVDENGKVVEEAVVGNNVRVESMLGILGVTFNAGGLTSRKAGDANVACKARAGATSFLKINIA